jgi:hypothetical protein
LSAIGAGLFSIGIPKNSIVEYETAIRTDRFLLLVHGTTPEVEKARSAVERTRPISVAMHAQESVAV